MQRLSSNCLVVVSNSVSVKFAYQDYKGIKIKSHIKEIIVGDQPYKLGDRLSFVRSGSDKSNPYYNELEINLITIGNTGNKYEVRFYQERLNDSIVYVTPMISTSIMNKAKQYSLNDQLMNTYIDEDRLILKYRYENSRYYENLTNNLKEHSKLLDIKHSKDKLYDFYIFQISNKQLKNLETFEQSQWHQFSPKYISKIKSFHGLDDNTYIMKVLNHDKELRKAICRDLGLSGIRDSVPLKNKIKQELEFISLNNLL